GMDAIAAPGNNLLRSMNRDGNAGRAGIFREIERAFLEGQHAAVERAHALNKCCDVQPAGEYALRVGNGFLRAFGVADAIDRNEVGQLERVADDGKLQERALEKYHRAAGQM